MIFDFGWAQYWDSYEDVFGSVSTNTTTFHFPGVGIEAARILYDRGIYGELINNVSNVGVFLWSCSPPLVSEMGATGVQANWIKVVLVFSFFAMKLAHVNLGDIFYYVLNDSRSAVALICPSKVLSFRTKYVACAQGHR